VPSVFASATTAEGISVAVGSQVHVFDGRCTALLTPSLDFESGAERLAWSNCGTFVVIATSNGSVHFLNVNSKKVIFSQNLYKPTASSSTAFAALDLSTANADGEYSLVALTSTGMMFYFKGIDLLKLSTALQEQNMYGAQLLFCSRGMCTGWLCACVAVCTLLAGCCARPPHTPHTPTYLVVLRPRIPACAQSNRHLLRFQPIHSFPSLTRDHLPS
jgi:hypothetical protein